MSEYKELYKNTNQLKEHQIARRRRLLDEQKRQRENEFSVNRDLKKDLSNHHQRKVRLHPLFKNILMLSEWMMVKPEDVEDFFLIPCPVGVRCSLSTSNDNRKIAMLYYKNGAKFMEIRNSNIPAYSIFDCVYNKDTGTIYILDVIAYGGRDLLNCDAEFRFFWIKSKFTEENLKLDDESKRVHLDILPAVDMTDIDSVRSCFQTHPVFENNAELDGYLFYHKKGSYTSGLTPLVLWLFPFMIEELFDEYQVNQSYFANRPEHYSNYLNYIKEFDEKMAKRKKKKPKVENVEMDIADHDDSHEEMQAMIELEMSGNDV